jgi:hypothetical protein
MGDNPRRDLQRDFVDAGAGVSGAALQRGRRDEGL